jgi:hypothetical protein
VQTTLPSGSLSWSESISTCICTPGTLVLQEVLYALPPSGEADLCLAMKSERNSEILFSDLPIWRLEQTRIAPMP